jgi:hypothetical protein
MALPAGCFNFEEHAHTFVFFNTPDAPVQEIAREAWWVRSTAAGWVGCLLCICFVHVEESIV